MDMWMRAFQACMGGALRRSAMGVAMSLALALGLMAPAQAALVIDTSALPTTVVGQAYSQAIAASGGLAPYSFAIVSATLPAGLALNGSSGAVTGTPTEAGSFTFTVQVNDMAAESATEIYTLVVGSPTLAMTPGPGNLFMAWEASNSLNFAASGGTAPYNFSMAGGSLPVGLSLSPAGLLSGIPSVSGNYNIVVQAMDSSTGTGAPFRIQQNYTIVVGMIIDLPGLPNGTAGQPYQQTLSASGGVAPYTFSLLSGTLPTGLAFTSAGELSGTPRSDGNFSVNLRATDQNGQTASKVYTFSIAPATVVITPASLAGATQGVAYSQSLSSSGGIAPYSYALVSGNMPVGLGLSSAGMFHGTPTTQASYTFAVRSTDDAGYSSTANYTVVVAPVLAPAAPAPIPVLGPWSLLLLSGLVPLCMGIRSRKARPGA